MVEYDIKKYFLRCNMVKKRELYRISGRSICVNL